MLLMFLSCVGGRRLVSLVDSLLGWVMFWVVRMCVRMGWMLWLVSVVVVFVECEWIVMWVM